MLNEYQIIQYIEGEENSVKQLYSNIFLDKRHTSIYLVKEETIQKRLFNYWSMGYKNIKYLTEKELNFINHYDLTNIEESPLLFQKFLSLGSE